MAAPTKPAKREKSSCQPGAVHTWHLGTVDAMQHYVRCRWQIRSGGEKLKALLLTLAV
jgi:hypothetical protein